MPEQAIIDAMDQALSILQAAEIPLLVRLAAFHYFFEYIHPFYDEMAARDDLLCRIICHRNLVRILHCGYLWRSTNGKMHITKCLRRRAVSGIAVI